jgi:hypothetical protein
MISKYCIGKDVEGTGHGLLWGIIPEVA